MIMCPRCLTKINKELHEVVEGFKCLNCKQIFDNLNAISVINFCDCVSRVRYLGINTKENASLLLKMMQ